MEVVAAIEELDDDILRSRSFTALATVQRTIDLFGADTAFSFNGGKDSTVLLHLIRAALAQRQVQAPEATNGRADAPSSVKRSFSSDPGDLSADRGSQLTGYYGAQHAGSTSSHTAAGNSPHDEATVESKAAAAAAAAASVQLRPNNPELSRIRTFVFHRPDDFQEIRDYMEEVDELYDLRLQVLTGDFKAGLERLVGDLGVRAIFLGTRRGDPNAKGQEFFTPSSVGWPPFMRVNPVLDWTYGDVWAFLRAVGAPYCSLYDRGFTSVGGIDNTEPNSALQKEDGSYAPAHSLPDGRLERAGRTSKPGLKCKPSHLSTLTHTAGLVIIGDEILSAKVEDANTPFLCNQLRSIGWQVKRVVVVPDDVAAIAVEVHAMSAELDLVITAGGVGPTPDDVTMAGVAAGMGAQVTRDSEVESRLREYFGRHLTAAHLKLAELPQLPDGDSEMVDHSFDGGGVSPFSLPRCRNLYILPGVPTLLQQKWRTLREHLLKDGGEGNPFRTITLRLSVSDETLIAPALEHLQSEMRDQLGVGSYPVSDQPDGAGIVLSLEAKNPEVLQRAKQVLIQRLPTDVKILRQASDPTWRSIALARARSQ